MSRAIVSPTDALRSPNWRYSRASHLCDSGRPASRTQDDHWIHALCYCVRKRGVSGRCGAVRSQRSAIAAALDVYESQQAICPALEAHFLSGAASSQIAERFGLAPAEADAYHDCFFDVRDRLTHVDFIMQSVILGAASHGTASHGPASHGAARPRAAAHHPETAFKLISYWGGPAALEQVLGGPISGDRTIGDQIARISDATEALLSVLEHLLVLQDGAAVNSIACASLAQSIRRRAAELPQPLNAYETNVQAVLDSLQFRCGQPDPEDYPPNARPFLTSAVELRADDMQILMDGGQLENAEELLAKRMPPPRRPEDAVPGTDFIG